MCPERLQSAERGFALMAALFIVVTLAAIGVYLVTISTGQVAASTQDEQATRAYQAARAGVEWAAYRVLIDSVCPTQNLTLPAQPPDMQVYRAEVSCAGTLPAETEGARQITAYKITATACNAAACSPAAPPATYV